MKIDQSTIALHQAIIRLARGMLTAWERWLADKQEEKERVS